MHYALLSPNANPQIVELLLEHGADINVQNNEGGTPLHYALLSPNANPKIVKLLLKHRVNVNAKNKVGRTFLYYALLSLYANPQIVELILEHGVNVNARDEEGSTPLHLALFFPNTNPEIVKLLLERGAKVNARDEEGKTPLHFALCHIEKNFLDLKATVDAENGNGKIPTLPCIPRSPWERFSESFFLLLLFDVDVNKEHQFVREKINKTPELKKCLTAFEEIKAMPHLGKLIEANIKKENAQAIAEYINNEAKEQELIKEFQTIEKYGSNKELSFVPKCLFSSNKLMTELKEICKEPDTALTEPQLEAVPSQGQNVA